VEYIPVTEGVDLFDVLSKTYLGRSVKNKAEIEIPADQACVIVELPSGMEMEKANNKLWIGEKIISYK
jgi:hypothetical protein